MLRSCLFLLAGLTLLASCSDGANSQPAAAAKGQGAHARELRQLEAMPAPAGVAAETWELLKGTLRAMLLSDSPRTASAAPAQAQSYLTFDGTATLNWDYARPGDYNQDSEVNISDLTPLGASFLQSVAPAKFPRTAATSVVDGDDNGEINISDITPIGANFHASVRKYNVYASLNAADYPSAPDAVSTIAPLGSVDFTAATGNKATQRLQFSFAVQSPQPGASYWVRPSDGTSEGTPSNMVAGLAINPPAVTLSFFPDTTVNPALGSPMWLTFSAQASGGSGTYTQFEYDLDNDGTFETVRPDGSRFGQLITGAGNRVFTVRVTDDASQQGMDSKVVLLKNGPDVWHAFVLDTRDSGTGINNAAAQIRDVNGNPAVVYNVAAQPSDSDNLLLYRRADDANGTAWGASVELASGFVNQGGVGFALVDSYPTVAFGVGPALAGPLVLRRADDPLGLTWGGNNQIIDSADPDIVPYVADYTSDIIAPKCGVAHGNGARDLMTSGNSDSDETNWFNDTAHQETFTTPGVVRPGLLHVGPALCLSWSNALAGDGTQINYHVLNGISPIVEAATALDASPFISSMLVDGLPAILFADTDPTRGLTYVRALDVDGTTWGTPVLIPGGGLVLGNEPVALAVVNGNPAVLWGSSSAFGTVTMYSEATDPQGTAWGTPTILSLDEGPWLHDLTGVGANPAIIVGTTGFKHETLYFGRY